MEGSIDKKHSARVIGTCKAVGGRPESDFNINLERR
jgi:hypothetical protein